MFNKSVTLRRRRAEMFKPRYLVGSKLSIVEAHIRAGIRRVVIRYIAKNLSTVRSQVGHLSNS